MQSIKAMTADVISSLDLSMAQRCLLKKAVLTAQSALSPPTTAGAGGAAVSGQLASELDALESSILALSQNKEGDKDSEKTGQGKTKSLPRAHEAIYLKPRTGKTDAKVNPLELSYSEFIAGYFSILDGLLQSGEHLQAQQLCRYLKFLSKKAIAFTTTAILQFDDEFRGMVARGEAAYDDHTSLNDLQAHHFDSSAVKTTTTRPKIAVVPVQVIPKLVVRSLSANTATSGTRIPITVQGAITHTRVSCATPRNTEPYFIALNLPKGKNLPPIDQLQRQRPPQPLQSLFLHRARLSSLQTLICKTFALLRAISTLGVEKWTLTPATKILFSRASHMVFILSTTSLLFRQRTAKIIGAPKTLMLNQPLTNFFMTNSVPIESKKFPTNRFASTPSGAL